MQNYFNYFTEIEQRFQQRRGSLLLLSTLDWALIESWRESGITLEAVLRGIDATFDKRDASKAGSRPRRINGLAWCAQAVMEQDELMREASVGLAGTEAQERADTGFEPARIARHLDMCASQLQTISLSPPAHSLMQETVERLRTLGEQVYAATPNLEDLDRTLRVMEEKLLAILLATTEEKELVVLREQASREIAPYRNRMQALQIRQIEQQFLHKRLLERYQIPRLSLFYMSPA